MKKIDKPCHETQEMTAEPKPVVDSAAPSDRALETEISPWNGPGEKPHSYSPDYMAMGDCRVCGHTWEAHNPKERPGAGFAGSAKGSCATDSCNNPGTALFEDGSAVYKYCTDCYEKAEAKAATHLPQQTGRHPDDDAVDRFATEMKAKLARKRAEGRGGWEGPSCSVSHLSGLLREHVEKGDPIDVANLAMMLHQRGEKITLPDNDLLQKADRMLSNYEEGHSLKAKDVLLLLRADLANRANQTCGGMVSIDAAISAVEDHFPGTIYSSNRSKVVAALNAMKVEGAQ